MNNYLGNWGTWIGQIADDVTHQVSSDPARRPKSLTRTPLKSECTDFEKVLINLYEQLDFDRSNVALAQAQRTVFLLGPNYCDHQREAKNSHNEG